MKVPTILRRIGVVAAAVLVAAIAVASVSSVAVPQQSDSAGGQSTTGEPEWM